MGYFIKLFVFLSICFLNDIGRKQLFLTYILGLPSTFLESKIQTISYTFRSIAFLCFVFSMLYEETL